MARGVHILRECIFFITPAGIYFIIHAGLTLFMRDTLLGVPLGKQFGSQSRPHIVGPALRAKLFATRTIFLQ